jgi:hypothetical protein
MGISPPTFAKQHRMVGQPDNHAGLDNLAHRVLYNRSGVLVDDMEHLLYRLSGRISHAPSG